MNLTVFLNDLGFGGTEKAACLWAGLLKQRQPDWKIQALSLQDGPRRADLERFGIPLDICPTSLISNNLGFLSESLHSADVIHAHCPGTPHQGDILGQTLKKLGRKIPVVQTNIFGRLDNPREDEWTDFRLFISWTSCVQAARRSGRKLNRDFFRHQSVAVYPVIDPFGSKVEGQRSRAILQKAADEFRASIGLDSCHVLFGRFSRPEPNKWTPLVLDAFLAAYRENPNIRLLLREPPPAVAAELVSQNLARWHSSPDPRASTLPILLLPATSDPEELTISQLACDDVLHTSSFGESFGYGLAEPMALGKPVITNATPWRDQAQIELVKHGECGLIASTVSSMRRAILRMAESNEWRVKCGVAARRHILALADAEESTARLLTALKCAMEGSENPLAERDLEKARETAEYLDKHQWGHNLSEQAHLRFFTAKVNAIRAFYFLKKKMRTVTSVH